jgi:methyl-accepting chemotaxis protein
MTSVSVAAPVPRRHRLLYRRVPFALEFRLKFRRHAPAVIIGAIVIAVAAITGLSNRLFTRQMDAIEAGQFEQMRAIVEFNIHGTEDKALARAEMIASMPEVRDAFAARDRAGLLEVTGHMYEVQHEKYGMDQSMFAVPPATSFLRLNAPEKFDEDLSAIRPMVVAVNRDHVAAKGLSVGRSGPALFGVVPVFDRADQFIGSYEIGLDFGPMLDKLKAAYGLDLVFVVKAQTLHDVATNVDHSVFDEHNEVGEYLKYASTNWELMRDLVHSEDLAKLDGDPVEYTRASVGVDYGVVMITLRNASGDPIGVICAARDFSAFGAAKGRTTVLQIASALLAIVLLAGLVIVVIRGFLLAPLAEIDDSLAALAKGDASKPIDDADRLCDELQSVASHVEALRTKAGGA